MNYKLAFIYNLLKIISRQQIIKPSKSLMIIPKKTPVGSLEQPDTKLFNKSPSKYTYPMGMK
jgi:hypothetical protein